MPGFATSERTLDQSRRLMSAVGCTANEVDIRPSCMQMFKDIGHPFAEGKPVYDVTFENVQAGERTSHLFRLANVHNAPVVGTSDLSELALGWCTYGVGDHMAHYHVNASVPKTLIQYLIRYVARTNQLGTAGERGAAGRAGHADQPRAGSGQERARAGPEHRGGGRTLRAAGLPPVLHPALRLSADQGRLHGLVHLARPARWATGPTFPEDRRNQYAIGDIKKWLAVFVRRFFQFAQYKRSAIPNAPKVGSGGSLSPRSDYRAPSDSEATVWLADVERIPDQAA